MSNVIQNLNLWNIKSTIPKDESQDHQASQTSIAKSFKMSDLPLLSEVKQDVSQGYLNEIYKALENHEE